MIHTTHDETREQHRLQVAKLCALDFARHELVAEGEGRWVCRRPGTMLYSFRVITAPGLVVVAGDIGDAILHHSDRDSLAWLCGSARGEHPDYVLGKVVRPEKTFLSAEARAWVAEHEAGDEPWMQRLAANIRENCNLDDLYYEDWISANHELQLDRGDSFLDWSSEMLRVWHALKLFVRLFEAEAKATAPAEVARG